RPEPRVVFGRELGERRLARAMIDVSDGLAQDLAHICEESGVAAIIDFDAVPVAEETGLATNHPDAAFDLAVNGGEDYELLFTAGNEIEVELFALAAHCGLRLTRIGEIVDASGPSSVLLRRDGHVKPFSIRGFDHFSI